MKKSLRLLLIYLSLFVIGIKSVNAVDTVRGRLSFPDDRNVAEYLNACYDQTDAECSQRDHGWVQYHFPQYTFNASDGSETSILYCIDAGYSNTDRQEVTFEKKLLDESNPEEAGIINILSSSIGNYAEKTLAIRIYKRIFGNTKNCEYIPGGTYIQQRNCYANNEAYAYKIALDDDIRNYINELGKSIPNGGPANRENKFNTHFLEYHDLSEGTVAQLLKEALNTAVSTQETVNDANVITIGDPVINSEHEDGKYKKSITYNFKASEFDFNNVGDDGSFVKASFKCDNCTSLGVSYKVYINDEDVTSSIESEVQILNNYGVTSGNERFSIKIEFEADDNGTYQCSDEIDFNLHIEDSAPAGVGEYEYYLYKVQGSVAQDFYGGSGEEISVGTEEDYTEDDFTLCDTDCDAWYYTCNDDPNATQTEKNEACRKFTEAQCPPPTTNWEPQCTTYVSNVKCDTSTVNEDIVLDIVEGIGGTDSVCQAQNKSIDVYNCVTGGYSETHNAEVDIGKDLNEESYELMKNTFCNVACVENYHIELPNAKPGGIAGKSISVEASLKGGLTCFTSEINIGDPNVDPDNNSLTDHEKSSFEYKYEVEKRKMLEASNLSDFYTALANSINSTPTQPTPTRSDYMKLVPYTPTPTWDWDCSGFNCGNQYICINTNGTKTPAILNFECQWGRCDLNSADSYTCPSDQYYTSDGTCATGYTYITDDFGSGLCVAYETQPLDNFDNLETLLNNNQAAAPIIYKHEISWSEYDYRDDSMLKNKFRPRLKSTNGIVSVEYDIDNDGVVDKFNYSISCGTSSCTITIYGELNITGVVVTNQNYDNEMWMYNECVWNFGTDFCAMPQPTVTQAQISSSTPVTLASLLTALKASNKTYITDSTSLSIPSYLQPIYNSLPNYNCYDSTSCLGNASSAKIALTNASNAINTYVNELNECSDWQMPDYNLDQSVVEFGYDEVYINGLSTQQRQLSKTVGTPSSGSYYCDSTYDYSSLKTNVHDNKPTCSRGTETTTVQKDSRRICQVVGDSIDCYSNVVQVPKTETAYKYLLYDEANKATYTTPENFCTLFPSGVVVLPTIDNTGLATAHDICEGVGLNLGHQWPLEFTGAGVYTYSLKFKKLGLYLNQTDKYGRVWNAGEPGATVVSTARDKSSSCGGLGNIGNQTSEYFCSYDINCPDCPSDCDPAVEICELDDCPDCPTGCPPDEICIIDGKENFTSRPITENKINPNNRDLGKNWKWDNNISDSIELKAYVTTEQIEEDGERVFEASYNSSVVLGNNFSFEIDMTAEMINWVKKYNRGEVGHSANNEARVYTDDSLDCYDYGDYKGIFCYSKFIDDLIEHDANETLIKINGQKPSASVRPLDAALRKNNSENSGYWTVWTSDNVTSALNGKNNWVLGPTHSNILMNINTYTTYNTNSDSSGVGPAWK